MDRACELKTIDVSGLCPICSFKAWPSAHFLDGHPFARAKVVVNKDTMDWDLRWLKLLAGVIMTLSFSAQAIAEDVESPKDDIAAQIRAQGYACDQPQSATRNIQASKPDEEVWLLRCEGASYLVRLIPDMAAHVERIDQ